MILIGLMLVLASVFVSPGVDYLTSGADEYTATEQYAPIFNQLEQHQQLPHIFSGNAPSDPFFIAELGSEGEGSEGEDGIQPAKSSFTDHKDLLTHYIKSSAHPSSSRALLFWATTRIILYQVFLI